MAKTKASANLKYNAKRCYVYEYGSTDIMDGKITFSKRLLQSDEIDFVEALETRDIEIENASGAKNVIPLAGMEVDADALNLMSDILSYYEEKRSMPDRVDKN